MSSPSPKASSTSMGPFLRSIFSRQTRSLGMASHWRSSITHEQDVGWAPIPTVPFQRAAHGLWWRLPSILSQTGTRRFDTIGCGLSLPYRVRGMFSITMPWFFIHLGICRLRDRLPSSTQGFNVAQSHSNPLPRRVDVYSISRSRACGVVVSYTRIWPLPPM